MKNPQLTFEKPDTNTFTNLALAYDALKKGGNMPCILNAANEVAVDAFINDKIKFLQIAEVVENTLAKSSFKNNLSYDQYVETDKQARLTAKT